MTDTFNSKSQNLSLSNPRSSQNNNKELQLHSFFFSLPSFLTFTSSNFCVCFGLCKRGVRVPVLRDPLTSTKYKTSARLPCTLYDNVSGSYPLAPLRIFICIVGCCPIDTLDVTRVTLTRRVRYRSPILFISLYEIMCRRNESRSPLFVSSTDSVKEVASEG